MLREREGWAPTLGRCYGISSLRATVNPHGPPPSLFSVFHLYLLFFPFLFSILPLAILPSTTKVTVFMYHKRWKASREENRCPSFPDSVLLPYLQCGHEYFSLIILGSLTTQRPSLPHLQATGHCCQIFLISPT